jgi:hypothetical protein
MAAPAEARTEDAPAEDASASDQDAAAPFPEEGTPTREEETDAGASHDATEQDTTVERSYDDELITEPSIEAVEQRDAVLLGFYQPVLPAGDDPTARASFRTLLGDAGTGFQGLLDGALDALSCGGLPACGPAAVPEGEEGSAGSGPEMRAGAGGGKGATRLDLGCARLELSEVEEERNDCAGLDAAPAEVEARQ